MKKQKITAGILTAAMLTGLFAAPAQAASGISKFSDTAGHWAYSALDWAVENDLMNGKLGGKMDPDGNLTRAELAAMLDRLFGTYKSADVSRFTDVSMEDWHYRYIGQAVQMGTLEGVSRTKMEPDSAVTREEAMAMVARTLYLAASDDDVLDNYQDGGAVSRWAIQNVADMADRGYIQGDDQGKLNPQAPITRAEMATILHNIFAYTYDSGSLKGRFSKPVLIRGDVTISNAVFEDDLIIANGLSEKDLELHNVTVKGRLIIWGASEVRVTGYSDIAGIVTPRNDGTVKVLFDEKATLASKDICEIIYPNTMDRNNEVIFSRVTLAPAIDFTLPAYLYVGSSAIVETTTLNVEDVVWNIKKDGTELTAPAFTFEGGTYNFTEPGSYEISVTATGEDGLTASCTRSIQILPVVKLGVSLPAYGHPDVPVDVSLVMEEDIPDAEIVWSMKKDGAAMTVPGGLTKEGGSITLTEPGSYELTAAYTDQTGKTYTDTRSIQILPLQDLTIETSAPATYTDAFVSVSLTETELPVFWILMKDGEPVEWNSATTSILDNSGGELMLRTAGEYTLVAAVQDESGRIFISNMTEIQVRTPLSLSVALSQDNWANWTDRDTQVSLAGNDGYDVTWSLTKDGAPASYVGSLSGNSGTIRIPQEGAYLLTASVQDDLGRIYEASTPIMIHSVVTLNLAPSQTQIYAGQSAAFVLTGTNNEGCTYTWNVKRDGSDSYLNLTDLSQVTFDQPGTYTISAQTSFLGRVFESNSVTVKAIRAGALSFVLPESAKLGEAVAVNPTISNLDLSTIRWTLAVDGKAVSGGYTGALTSAGGTIKFTNSGINTLTIHGSDAYGQDYSFSANISIS